MPPVRALLLLVAIFASSPGSVVVRADPLIWNMTDSVYFKYPQEDDTLRILQDTVYPFSALRNPVEGTLKVFFEVSLSWDWQAFSVLRRRRGSEYFQAQGYIAWHFRCEFTKDLLLENWISEGSEVHFEEGQLIMV